MHKAMESIAFPSHNAILLSLLPFLKKEILIMRSHEKTKTLFIFLSTLLDFSLLIPLTILEAEGISIGHEHSKAK